jgi:hypothetical protein
MFETPEGCSVAGLHIIRSTKNGIYVSFQLIPSTLSKSIVCDPVSSAAKFVAKVEFVDRYM